MFTYHGVSLESRVFTNGFVIEKIANSLFRKSIAAATSTKECSLKLFYLCILYCCLYLLMV